MCARLKLTPRVDMKTAPEVGLRGHAAISLDGKHFEQMRWGFKLPNGTEFFWARSEGMFQGMFRYQAMHHRGVVFIDGWWEKGQFIDVAKGTAAAVLWHQWHGAPERSFVLVTCEPWSKALANVHHRMPAIVQPDVWLAEETARLRRGQTLSVPARVQN